MSSNEDDLQSIFEPIAIKLIDEFFGLSKELKMSYPERTLHLANEYKIEKKKMGFRKQPRGIASLYDMAYSRRNWS